MKIKVINLKNISSYVLKILILVVIGFVFGKFFYGKRNVNASMKVESSKYLSILNKEISLFYNNSLEDENKNTSSYSKIVFNKEINLAQMTDTKDINNLNANYVYSNNTENMKSEMNNTNNNEVVDGKIDNYEENIETSNMIDEPEIRTKYRNSAIKCSRQIYI